MSALRWWIALLAGLSFTAGLGAGVLVSTRRGPPQAEGALAGYEALLVERFDLSVERARCLRALLSSYQREIDRLRSQRLTEYVSALEPELAMKSQEYDQLIREKVLPPAQRDEFAKLCTPVPFPLSRE